MNKVASSKMIEKRIEESEPGSVFITTDFVDKASSYDAANEALLRLNKEGKVRRVLRGIYEKPSYNTFLQEHVAPSPDKIARALARNFGWTIVPSGNTALNVLGLSTQVPATWEYVSDGSYKRYKVGNVTIKFKHTANKEISNLSYMTALTIRALKAMGKDNVDENVIQTLTNKLTDKEKDTMLSEAKYTTAWVYDVIKRVSK